MASLALIAIAALVVPSVATADLADETALAERYAPVVRLVAQAQECGYGESYEPIDVDVLFDEPTVALRGPWNPTDLVKIGPTAADLSNRFEYHLDFPGHALDPGCGYERWADRVTEGTKPTVYAHVVTDPGHPGKVALQYWFYYVFNDWNNTHEGDWEMVQLVFDAADAREALDGGEPVEIGYSQHEGAERASWGDAKLEVVEGSHPVVYPAAGSHANFYESALHVGSSASEGVGCDDTSGPSLELRPHVQTIPSDPAGARAAYPWIDFQGRWGELQPAFFNGPTGPNLKTQWTEPIRWSEDWRDASIAVPGGGALGTGATDFFCEAVAAGSNALRRAADDPAPTIAVLLGLLVLVAFALSRATWRPTAPFRLARRRAWGQILAAAGGTYLKRFPLFLGIGLVFLPISVILTFLQALLLSASNLVGVHTDGESRGFLVVVVVALGTTLTLLGLGLVMAATLRALVEIDAGRRIGPLQAYRLAFDSVEAAARRARDRVGRHLAAVSARCSSCRSRSGWQSAGRWSSPRSSSKACPARPALRRSAHLVRQEWLKVASLIVVGGALAVIAGPLIGALLILITSTPLALLNVVAAVVYAVAMPFVALTATYVYFDTRVRDELVEEPEPHELPAEIQLSS